MAVGRRYVRGRGIPIAVSLAVAKALQKSNLGVTAPILGKARVRPTIPFALSSVGQTSC